MDQEMKLRTASDKEFTNEKSMLIPADVKEVTDEKNKPVRNVS